MLMVVLAPLWQLWSRSFPTISNIFQPHPLHIVPESPTQSLHLTRLHAQAHLLCLLKEQRSPLRCLTIPILTIILPNTHMPSSEPHTPLQKPGSFQRPPWEDQQAKTRSEPSPAAINKNTGGLPRARLPFTEQTLFPGAPVAAPANQLSISAALDWNNFIR